jgi:hypothetical protein
MVVAMAKTLRTAASVIFAAWRDIYFENFNSKIEILESHEEARGDYVYITTLIFVQYSQRSCMQKSLS